MKAAVRVLGIALEGFDVEPIGEVKNRRPSQIQAKKVRRVPGVHGPAANVFGVSQVVSWIAGQRADMAEEFEWRTQVQGLMENLLARSSASARES